MYKVKIKNTIELDAVEASSFVAEVLKEDFEFIAKEINGAFDRRTELKPYEREDMIHNMEIFDAIKVLLRYYLTHNEYTEFMEMQRVYGNVR